MWILPMCIVLSEVSGGTVQAQHPSADGLRMSPVVLLQPAAAHRLRRISRRQEMALRVGGFLGGGLVLLGGGLALGGYRSGSSYAPIVSGAALATLVGAPLATIPLAIHLHRSKARIAALGSRPQPLASIVVLPALGPSAASAMIIGVF